MHDLLLDDTTNVADMPQYADRYTTKVLYVRVSMWFMGVCVDRGRRSHEWILRQ